MNDTGSYHFTEESFILDLLNNSLNRHNRQGINDENVEAYYPSIPYIYKILTVWVIGIVCLMGLVANIISFLVLTKVHGQSPMFFVLRALAISDAIFLVSAFVIFPLYGLPLFTDLGKRFALSVNYIFFCIWPIGMMTQTTTIWLTVLVSFERYKAICFPLNSVTICTMSKVRKAVTIICVVSVIYNIPRYFEYNLYKSHNTTSIPMLYKSAVWDHWAYRYFYAGALYSLMLFVIPLLMLIFLNFKLVMALKEGRKQWETLLFQQKKQQNFTRIPLTIVLMFFICGVPSLVVNIIDSINPHSLLHPNVLVFLGISNLLVALNSACNFIIYCLLGKKFRSNLIKMCRCKCA